MRATIIEPGDYRSMRWRNGLGQSMEIAAAPGGDAAPWRFGIATIDRSCPFSIYPAHDRTILPLDIDGFVLTFSGDESGPLTVDDPMRPVAFGGEWPAECRLLGGPVRAVNVMTDRTVFTHRVSVVSLTGEPVDCPLAGNPCLVLALRGDVIATIGGRAMTLTEHATLRLDGSIVPSLRLAALGPVASAYVVGITEVRS
ncbi:MAG TPA: HutD family protein [Stellaceae bacterium]|nr:HutD family protein [Stellaceae bacterium]